MEVQQGLRPRRVNLFLGAAAVALSSLGFLHAAFVGGNYLKARWLPQRDLDPAADSAVARRVSFGGHGAQQIILKIPKARGFAPPSTAPVEEMQSIEIRPQKAQKNFVAAVKNGKSVSEVYYRVEGKTPWKRVGEITNTKNNFADAIIGQRELLIRRTYYLYKKSHLYLSSLGHVVQFGYTDENADIVPVDTLLDEGTSPMVLKAMVDASGFRPDEKPWHWRSTKYHVKHLEYSRKDRHIHKPWLQMRRYNLLIAAHKWYNPQKYKGRYTQMIRPREKHSLVVGNGPSR